MSDISIIIPMYNEERYLQRCINSLLNQSLKNFELIFVDDGSTDQGIKIVEDFSKKDNRIKLFKQNHGGPGKARNFGASQAKGEILVLVDADMVFDKDYVKDLVKPILEGKAIGTSHRYEFVANVKNLWARSWSINRIPDSVGKWSGVFRAIRKDKFLEAGGFDSSKGYFDDDLSKVGLALMVNATCYHNNPETLREVFKHSMWVGGSFYKNKKTLKSYLRTYSLFLLILSILFIFVLLIFLNYSISLSVLFFLILTIFLLSLEVFSFKRVIKEKRWEYLYSIPILMAVKLNGYLAGLMKEMVK